jgi:hypothetical protein
MDDRTTTFGFGKRFIQAPDLLAARLSQYGLAAKPPQLLRGLYHLEISQPADISMLMSQKVEESMMHKLFWRGNGGATGHFICLLDRSPHYQLWKVKPDFLKDAPH